MFLITGIKMDKINYKFTYLSILVVIIFALRRYSTYNVYTCICEVTWDRLC
jgi:hypothetical protein